MFFIAWNAQIIDSFLNVKTQLDKYFGVREGRSKKVLACI